MSKALDALWTQLLPDLHAHVQEETYVMAASGRDIPIHTWLSVVDVMEETKEKDLNWTEGTNPLSENFIQWQDGFQDTS